MYNSGRRSAEEVQTLRREAGRWLKAQRERAGLSQTQLALRLGTDHYTFISQVEIGRSRIPPDRYRDWAVALEQPVVDFTRAVMRFYDPELSAILFGDADENGSNVGPEMAAR